ncbi:MAG: hypothetical protein WA117_16595 [Verrucomicrobiia bacterium]
MRKTIEISARCKTVPGVVDALFDAMAVPSTKLLTFCATDSEGEISVSLVAEELDDVVSILRTAGFECHGKQVGQ